MLKHRWASAALIRQSQDPGAFPFTPVTHVDILFPKGMRTSVGSSLTLLETQKKGDLGRENSEGSGINLPEF